MKDKVVLIGMPGCGKTTIGKIISKKCNLNFYDMDKYIEEKENKTISEIFSTGEENFRDIESKACEELSKLSKAIISTGGGAVKRKANIDCFKDNSLIIFIDRPVDMILKDVDISKRPLLKDDKNRLLNLYNERINFYREYSNVIVKNDSSLKECVNSIIQNIKAINLK